MPKQKRTYTLALVSIFIYATTCILNASSIKDELKQNELKQANIAFNSKVYFMPNDGKQALGDIINAIKNAKENIKIAMYSFRHKKIAKALKQASQNGVKVYVVFDDRVLKLSEKSIYGYLKKYKNINVYTIKGLKKGSKGWGKMHSKYMIVDDKKLFFGSANFKTSSFSFNYEVLYFSNEASLVENFVKNFKSLRI